MIDFGGTVEQYSLLAMLGGGLLAFISPCVLPMLPVYAMYLMGGGTEGGKAGWGLVLRRCLGLALSFILLFMLMGAGAGFLGAMLKNANRAVLDIACGALMILFGLWMLGILCLTGMRMPSQAQKSGHGGFWSAAAMGLVLALSWTACLTPILSGALVLAASTQNATMWTGMLQLAVFGLGLCLPMLLCMLLYQWLGGVLGWLKRHHLLLRRTGGGLMVAYGVYLIVNAL